MQTDKEYAIQLAMEYGFTGSFDAQGDLTYDSEFVQAILEAIQHEREACAQICEDQQIRSAEASEKAKRVTDSKLYHHCSVTAGWNAAAIRARGEAT